MNLKSYFLKHFYKYLKQSFPFITIIIIVDLLPLIAVIWGGWSAIEALYLYALETIILLWITQRKMWKSKYMLALLVDQTKNVVSSINQRTFNVKSSFKIPFISWILKGAKGLLFLIFIIIWLPLILLQLMIISAISGDGFGIWGFLEHNSGQLDLGFVSLNLLFVFLFLLFIEHTYAYRNKFIKEKEYENTGLLNEAFSFSLRVFIQQFIIIGIFAIIGLMHFDTIYMVFIILFKTLMDIFTYLFNRVWGGIKDKWEANS